MTPPRIFRRLLAHALHDTAAGRSVIGDLDEEFDERAAADAARAASWYRREALGILVRAHAISRRPSTAGPRRPGDSLMHQTIADLGEAVRTLRKQPRLLLLATLTLALGIGAVTSIFSVVNGVLFRPLPSPHAERLVNVWSSAPGLGFDQFPLSPDLYLFFQRHNTVFEDMALSQGRRANLTESGPPEVVEALVATSSYFSTFGAGFSRGRAYSAAEDRPDGPPVVVVSERLWKRRYGADPGLVGRTVRIDGTPTEVVGVAPSWMDAPGSADLWLPARFNPASPPVGSFGWQAIGRLKHGVTVERATTALGPLVGQAIDQMVESQTYRAFLNDGKYRPLVRPMKEDVIGTVKEPLLILLGTVAMVLLVACGNVASLCLVHAEARQREIAVRVALGGSRWRLVRKLLAEAVVLAAIGGGAGVLVSALALPLLLSMAPASIPRLDQVRLDAAVVAFALAATLLSAVIFGLVPAIRYTRPNLLSVLRHGGRGSTDSPARQRGRHVLVIAQTAAALVLLVGAGLMARSFSRLMNTELGFEPRDVLTFRVTLPAATYPKAADVQRATDLLLANLSALPGVNAVGAGEALPMTNAPDGTSFEFSGHPVEAGRLPPIVWLQTVTPGLVKALGVALLQGRDFDSTERRDGVRSVIVNKALADRYWPGQNPIGRQLRRTGDGTGKEPWFTVVGVVAATRQSDLRQELRPQMYFPLQAGGDDVARTFTYALRGSGTAALGEAVRRAVWAVDRELPIASMQSLEQAIEASVVQFSFTMLTLSTAALITLVLGSLGLYGVLSYAVSLRTRELGVRLALGAQPAQVMRMVVASGVGVAAAGLVVGSLGAALLTRLLAGMLYETQPLDALTFTVMPLVLLAVALVASYLPARRAARVSPLEAMRAD